MGEFAVQFLSGSVFVESKDTSAIQMRQDRLPEDLPLRRGDQTRLSTIIFLISAIALAGLRPFGQTFAQFMIVWQR